MPRIYIKKGKNNQWTSAQLAAALKSVSEGMSIRGAATRYHIPSSTLHDHVSGKRTRVHSGAPTVLTASEEKEVVTSCEVMQQLGLAVALRDFLKERGRDDRFKNGIPGSDWWSGFFRRHPKLVERKPEHLPKCRAEAANPEVRKIQQ